LSYCSIEKQNNNKVLNLFPHAKIKFINPHTVDYIA